MSERNYRLYLIDILESGNAILEYIKGISIIGEAVGKLPDDVKQRYHDVEWQDIKDFRNLLMHEYFGVDLEIVWKVIEEDLPGLMKTINEVMKETP